MPLGVRVEGRVATTAEFTRWVAHFSTRLTVRGAVLLLVGLLTGAYAALGNSPDALFIAGVLFLAPLVASVYVSLRPARVDVTRVFHPSTVSVGGESVISLEVRNLSATPLGGAWWCDSPPPGIDVPPSAILPVLGRTGSDADTVRLEYSVVPRHRGVYDVGPLKVSRHDPFGLAHSDRIFGVPHDLVVMPRVTALPSGGPHQSTNDGSIRELVRQATPTSDELIAREYRPGDALRRVNWPATARHGELMVRQEEQRSNPEARLVLDTTLNGAVGRGAGHLSLQLMAAFECEIELAASIGMHLLGAGFRLEVVELGASQLLPGDLQILGGLNGDVAATYRTPGGDRTMLEALASVVPVPVPGQSGLAAARLAPPPVALRGAQTALPTFAVLVVVSDADVDGLVALSRHSQPAIAFVQRTVSKVARDRLRAANWRCIDIASIAQLDEAWNGLSGSDGGTDA